MGRLLIVTIIAFLGLLLVGCTQKEGQTSTETPITTVTTPIPLKTTEKTEVTYNKPVNFSRVIDVHFQRVYNDRTTTILIELRPRNNQCVLEIETYLEGLGYRVGHFFGNYRIIKATKDYADVELNLKYLGGGLDNKTIDKYSRLYIRLYKGHFSSQASILENGNEILIGFWTH